MTFLPIVGRELRVTARRRGTYWNRALSALAAILIFGGALIFEAQAPPKELGKHVFDILSGLFLLSSLAAGVRYTADCLSEEKREGTLGLLFLTDLHGYDVVLGKFVARLVSALYGLLALLPITAFPLLLGGVTIGEFWRTSLALVNMLFVSLAGGIWISALARDAQRAMGRALGLILILVAGLPALAGLASLSLIARPLWLLSWISPFFAFSYASAAPYPGHVAKFWGTLAASQVLGWVFLALASRALPYRWQEGSAESRAASFLDALLRRGRGQPVHRAKARQELLPIHPILG